MSDAFLGVSAALPLSDLVVLQDPAGVRIAQKAPDSAPVRKCNYHGQAKPLVAAQFPGAAQGKKVPLDVIGAQVAPSVGVDAAQTGPGKLRRYRRRVERLGRRVPELGWQKGGILRL